MSVSVELRGVHVEGSNGEQILRDVGFRVEAGVAVALLGRSGAGKTTALKLVNGLVAASAGEVLVDDRSIEETDLIALRRRIGYVIQGVGLFPHRTVYQNVATVPRLLGWDDARTRERANHLLDLVGLPPSEYGERRPGLLSGGEKQRVGIVRALIFEPDILLCDEPFGALDPILRRELQETFVSLRTEEGTTILFVTHDLSEALYVTERLIILEKGEVVVDCPVDDFANESHSVAVMLRESASLRRC